MADLTRIGDMMNSPRQAPGGVATKIRECPLLETLLYTALSEEPADPLLHGFPAFCLLLCYLALRLFPVMFRPIYLRLLALNEYTQEGGNNYGGFNPDRGHDEQPPAGNPGGFKPSGGFKGN